MEKWKDISGYEGIYEVSNKGRVRTKEGKTTYSKKHGKRVWKSRILKNKNPKGRDVRVSLWKNGKPKDFLVHQLVAKEFIDNPKGYYCINHLDGNPRNNLVENLEWCNHDRNNNHAFDNDLIKTNKRIVLRNRKNGELKEFRSLSKASEFLGFNQGYLSRVILSGKDLDGFDIYLRVGDFIK